MTKSLTHAGTVVFRQGEGETSYLVVSSSDGANWVLPKGHIDPGETAEIAALRELQEEAGIVGEITATLSVRQFKKADKELSIQYFLIREINATESIESRTIRWEKEAAAVQLLTFPEAQAALLEGIAVMRRLEKNSENG